MNTPPNYNNARYYPPVENDEDDEDDEYYIIIIAFIWFCAETASKKFNKILDKLRQLWYNKKVKGT